MYSKFATNGNDRVYTVREMQKGYDMSVCTYAHYICVSFAFVKKSLTNAASVSIQLWIVLVAADPQPHAYTVATSNKLLRLRT